MYSLLSPPCRSQELRKERHVQRAKTRGEGGGGGEGRGREEEEEEGGRGEGGHDNLPLLGPEPLPDPADLEPFKVEEYKDLTKGSFDTGDPLTTNLYVGNINPKVSCNLCAVHGMSVHVCAFVHAWKCTCTYTCILYVGQCMTLCIVRVYVQYNVHVYMYNVHVHVYIENV